jgi:putative transposase
MSKPQQQTHRAYRYRFYPTPDHAATLARTFGCARYVYNWALQLRTEAYQERKEHLSYQETSAALTILKQQPDAAWLTEVASVPLQQVLRHLDTAFRNFFAQRAKYPVFTRSAGGSPSPMPVVPSATMWPPVC